MAAMQWGIIFYTVSQKKLITLSIIFAKILIDFQNYFTGTFCGKFAIW